MLLFHRRLESLGWVVRKNKGGDAAFLAVWSLLDSWSVQIRRGTADFVTIWSVMDSWFVQMRRGTAEVCKNIVQWLRVITRIGEVVNMMVNKGIYVLRLILHGIHQTVK
jgi:hypothetical protein